MKKQLLFFFTYFTITSVFSLPLKATQNIIIPHYSLFQQTQSNLSHPTVWHNIVGRKMWVLAPDNEVRKVLIFNAENGKKLHQAMIPNLNLDIAHKFSGTCVIENYILVVDQNNKCVNILNLSTLSSLGAFGNTVLSNPNDLAYYQINEHEYLVYIADNSVHAKNKTPNSHNDNAKVWVFKLSFNDGNFTSTFITKFGNNEGPGSLQKISSICVDENSDTILISEILDVSGRVTAYNLDGKFKGKIRNPLFEHSPQDIVLYKDGSKKGFFIILDQGKNKSRFVLIERTSLKILDAFSCDGISNASRMAIVQKTFGEFDTGALFITHSHNGLAAVPLSKILKILNE